MVAGTIIVLLLVVVFIGWKLVQFWMNLKDFLSFLYND